MYIFHHVVLALTLNSMMVNGFLYWPFSSNSENADERTGVLSSLFGSFLPSITWNRSPVFGISAYQHLDLGDPGEVRNDFQFRIGPKPQPTVDAIGNGLDHGYTISDEVDNNGIDDSNRRYRKKVLRNLDYQNDVNYLSNSDISEKWIAIDSEVIKHPVAKQTSPRYNISNKDPYLRNKK